MLKFSLQGYLGNQIFQHNFEHALGVTSPAFFRKSTFFNFKGNPFASENFVSELQSKCKNFKYQKVSSTVDPWLANNFYLNLVTVSGLTILASIATRRLVENPARNRFLNRIG
jgi:hypothetical protein